MVLNPSPAYDYHRSRGVGAEGQDGAGPTNTDGTSGSGREHRAYAGTFQLAADIEANEDGETWSRTNEAHAIMRDADNAVIFDEVLACNTPVMGPRVGSAIEPIVLPVAAQMAAIPAP